MFPTVATRKRGRQVKVVNSSNEVKRIQFVQMICRSSSLFIAVSNPDWKPNCYYSCTTNVVQTELNSTAGEVCQKFKARFPGSVKPMVILKLHHTTASFIRVAASEFVHMYLDDGPRMVRDVFRLAKENAPPIIFIDEVDAVATKRFDSGRGSDREVQRILLELLNQMDGFDQSVNVKVIMATNRADTLDPALLRPGRLDRKIEFPMSDRRQKRMVFSTVTAKMNLSAEVDLEDFVARPDKISAADINAVCQEAGMLAVRENCYIVLSKDFEKAYKTKTNKNELDLDFYK